MAAAWGPRREQRSSSSVRLVVERVLAQTSTDRLHPVEPRPDAPASPEPPPSVTAPGGRPLYGPEPAPGAGWPRTAPEPGVCEGPWRPDPQHGRGPVPTLPRAGLPTVHHRPPPGAGGAPGRPLGDRAVGDRGLLEPSTTRLATPRSASWGWARTWVLVAVCGLFGLSALLYALFFTGTSARWPLVIEGTTGNRPSAGEPYVDDRESRPEAAPEHAPPAAAPPAREGGVPAPSPVRAELKAKQTDEPGPAAGRTEERAGSRQAEERSTGKGSKDEGGDDEDGGGPWDSSFGPERPWDVFRNGGGFPAPMRPGETGTQPEGRTQLRQSPPREAQREAQQSPSRGGDTRRGAGERQDGDGGPSGGQQDTGRRGGGDSGDGGRDERSDGGGGHS